MENMNQNEQSNIEFSPELKEDVNPHCKKSDCNALHSVMKTVLMALHSLEHLKEQIKDQRDITKYLDDQVSAYKRIEEKANLAFNEIGAEGEKVTGMRDFMLKSSIVVNTILDDSDSKIADMMIKGTNMGIIEITKTLNAEGDCLSPACRDITGEILSTMNAFIEDMKKFL